ncbi:MAG: hypothetical protein KF773_32155 [Deltaproteobacteria bacterium]|nr:hypothetical protein [Deltaproteobacteria bacterium]MCW5808031.1 hypothetical protein [Deltaproteobacteria bacterium]
MATRGYAALLCTLVACGGDGTDDVTKSKDLLGRWAHASGGTMPAQKVTFDDDPIAGFTFTITLSAASFTSGTFEVLNDGGAVLLYPADPAATTWCAPGASFDGENICFADFDTRCEQLPGRAGVRSPLSGCFAPD